MVSSFLVSLVLLVMHKYGIVCSTHIGLLITIAVTHGVLGCHGLSGPRRRIAKR